MSQCEHSFYMHQESKDLVRVTNIIVIFALSRCLELTPRYLKYRDAYICEKCVDLECFYFYF